MTLTSSNWSSLQAQSTKPSFKNRPRMNIQPLDGVSWFSWISPDTVKLFARLFFSSIYGNRHLCTKWLNTMYLFRPIALSLISSFFVVACHLDAKSQLSDNFASGNLGVIKSATITNDNTSIQLDNDNHNSALSSIPLWRNWWYFKLSNMKKNRDFNVIVDDIFFFFNQGWQYDYTPVYSYD